MLQYLYTYEILNHGLTTATSLQLLILGDKYELEEIRDTGMQNLAHEITNLTAADGQWAAEWYPQISHLQQRGAEKLKAQLTNAIAKHAREMIKHEDVRELIANDGTLAVLLVEKLANPPSAMFGLSKDVPSSTGWWGSQGTPSRFGAFVPGQAPPFGGAAASLNQNAAFGSAGGAATSPSRIS